MEKMGIGAWRRERRAVSFSETDLGSKVIVAPNNTGSSLGGFQENSGPVRRKTTLVIKRKALQSARLQFQL